jgi:UDP-2,4-diacetamido-2,4,6-trideoxy-beta-L-altropyranose hydrolase
MKFVFRTDASIQIGTGHVMRCLTLADALTKKGHQCSFICREHDGNLIKQIRSKGHTVYTLPMTTDSEADLAHRLWLGATQAQDAQACELILAHLQPDWLVVDHYAIDARWEIPLSIYCGKVMVIDDLADRQHNCQVLLDQTFGRTAEDYRLLVPADSVQLCGSNYTLLRPEFAELRNYSLRRRLQPKLKNLLITMGGVDKDNITARVLNFLRASPLPTDCKITVVLGATAPWQSDVQQRAQTMPLFTTVHVGVDNMAQLMADSDLAIGAGGASSWERCCLGLPTIMIVLAENQAAVAAGLSKIGAAHVVELNNLYVNSISDLMAEICKSTSDLMCMSQAASKIVDGRGMGAVLKILGA